MPTPKQRKKPPSPELHLVQGVEHPNPPGRILDGDGPVMVLLVWFPDGDGYMVMMIGSLGFAY